jgi:single-stranded-DNA-specific exonuclease
VPSIHAVEALDSVRDKLLRYGGHPVAAGFSCKTENLEAVRDRLAGFVDSAGDRESLVPELTLDAQCPAHALTPALAEALDRLSPFGKGNAQPRLLVPGILPEGLRPMGQTGKHLRFRVAGVDAVWWSGDRFARDLQHPVDLAVKLGFNHWKGRRSLRLTVEDARPAVERPADDRDAQSD